MQDLQALGDVVGTVSRGLAPHLVEQLPTCTYASLASAHSASSSRPQEGDLCRHQGPDSGSRCPQQQQGEAERCCVCQCEYEGQDQVTALPCRHLYHRECIAEWLAGNKTCPTCNKEVAAPL